MGVGIASGDGSTAMGAGTASGDNSTAMGEGSTASGDNSTAMGFESTASGNYSTAMGGRTTASGNYATDSGYHITAQAYNSFVMGRYNVGGGTTGSWVSTDPLFEVGNGTDSSHKNDALLLDKSGNLTVKTVTTTAPGGDIPMYAGY